ncbi:MAG: response regulator [Candidatus Paceibacterota bacterium]|jgi:CheY-like chemotaxis protein
MKTVLFIDDEAALQRTLGEFLKQEGYNVLSALDGENGLELAKKQNPDLILLDLIMPKMNGFETLAALKSDPGTKSIPVIILTNLEDINDIDRAIEAGADSYLLKSHYSPDEVIEKINQVLGCK